MRIRRWLLIGVLACGGAVSCSGSKPPESCAPSGPTQTVQLQDYSFSPACIGAPVGTRLVLQNTGATKHTFTISNTPVNETVDAGAGAEVTLTGLAPGTYPVVCTIHPQMTATLVVS
jgi:plastocyanin